MRIYNTLGTFLWQVKACGVMLVGVGVKLAMYAPTAAADEHFAHPQRLEISIACGVCFCVQLFHCIAVKNLHHYSCKSLRAHPVHVLVVLSRVALLLGNIVGLSQLELVPWKFISLQAGLAVLQCILLHLQEHQFKITSGKAHPMAKLPKALKTLRHSIDDLKYERESARYRPSEDVDA